MRMLITKGHTVALILLSATLLLSAEPAALPDRIFLNSEVITMGPADPMARAMAIRANTMLIVGSNAEIKKLKVAFTMVEDLLDRTQTPKIINTHIHGC